MTDDWPEPQHRYVQASRYSEDAPKIPCDRPPTRAEVWAYIEHYYQGVRSKENAVILAIRIFTGNYIHWVQTRGWNMPPDWKEGEPAPPAAKPKDRIFDHNVSEPRKWRDQIDELLVANGKRPLPQRTAIEQKEEDEL